MARKSQVAYKSVKSALVSAIACLKAEKITKEQVTSQMAEQLGIEVADLETRYKRFKSQPAYKSILPELHYVSVGEQGRPRVSEAELAADAAELNSLLNDIDLT